MFCLCEKVNLGFVGKRLEKKTALNPIWPRVVVPVSFNVSNTSVKKLLALDRNTRKHMTIGKQIIIIIIIILLLMRFFLYQHQLVVFHRSLSDSKSPWVSRTLLSILANLSNAVTCIILILILISNSSILLSKPLGTVPSAPTTVGITFIFHSFSAIIIIIIKQE